MDKQDSIFDLGCRIRQLRQAKKLSQEELAKRVGVSKGTIYRYESNLQEPTFRIATKLAVNLGTSLDYLGGLENASVVRLPNMSEEQRDAVYRIVKLFSQPE